MRIPEALAHATRGVAAAIVLGSVPALGMPLAQEPAPADLEARHSPAASREGPEDSGADHEHTTHDAVAGLAIPMAQEGSGTGWVPASSPMHGLPLELGSWSAMVHYNLFAGVAAQGSRQREIEGLTANWVMGMARRDLSAGRLSARGMLSFELLLLERDGYPLVLQTGETAYGEPLVDRQHPHDLFMELSLAYDRPLTSRLGLQVYAAAAGEPALGPVAFPHRPSAAADPLAPIAHH